MRFNWLPTSSNAHRGSDGRNDSGLDSRSADLGEDTSSADLSEIERFSAQTIFEIAAKNRSGNQATTRPRTILIDIQTLRQESRQLLSWCQWGKVGSVQLTVADFGLF
jgi:hypothetical protein